MVLTLEKKELRNYLEKQLEIFFPDGLTEKYYKGTDIDKALEAALERLEYCFKHIKRVAYSDEKGQTFFSHLHADQYAQFLYYFMNSLWKESENKIICDKVLQLNKCLNNFFVSYKCSMPDIFFLGHPIGTILGNAVYSDYLVVFQNVTINTGDKEMTPKLGKGLALMSGAQIIGDEPIGDWVTVGVDAVVYKQVIPKNKTVIRNIEGKIEIRDSKRCIASEIFRIS